MATPTKQEIDKLNKQIDTFNKKLGEDGKLKENLLMTMLRTAIRKVWMTSPLKLAYLLEGVKPDMNPKTRTKWLVECEMCGKDFKKTSIQIDHLNGEFSLKTFDDIKNFFERIVNVTKEDLQRLCIGCHEIKTYAERYGLSLEEAAKEKEVIAKCKQPTDKQKKELKKAGFKADEISNADKRRECYRKLLKREV